MEGGKALQRLTCIRFVEAEGLGGRGTAVLSCQLLARLEPLKLTALFPVSPPPTPVLLQSKFPWPRTRAHGRPRCVITVAHSENALWLLAITFFFLVHWFPVQANCSKQPDTQVSGRVPPTVCRDS